MSEQNSASGAHAGDTPKKDVGLDTASFPAMPQAGSDRTSSNLVARMTLTQLTLIALTAVFAWQWFDAHTQLAQTRQEVAQKLGEMSEANKASQTQLSRDHEMVRELSAQLADLEAKYAETRNQRAALESLYQEMSSGRDQMLLAEVEQMLLIAGQQLQLSGNVKAALIAMQQADSRLQGVERPGLGNLRKSIGRDIERLRALPNFDALTINQRLENVLVAIDTLPLAQDRQLESTASHETSAAGEDQPAWRRVLSEIWQEVKQLVRVENTQQESLPLLSPTQNFYLRENLKLRLMSARMSLIARDEATFRRDLKTAHEWVRQYFDLSTEQGHQMAETLNKLAMASIAANLPDISGSLEAVRSYRASHERGVK